MKKICFFISALTASLLLFSLNAFAKTGDVTGKIYSTDILAEINGVPVKSYCLDGKTAIILEDLEQYGAAVEYNDALRVLVVNTFNMNVTETDVSRGQVGKVLGNTYETDIVTYINGYQVKSFALNGKTAAAIEDIANNDEYSIHGAKYTWNGEDRIISLECLTENTEDLLPLFNPYGLSYGIVGNELLEIKTDKFSSSCGGYHNADVDYSEADTYPLLYKGHRVGTLFPYTAVSFYEGNLEKQFLGSCKHFDLDAVKEYVLPDVDFSPPSYDEVTDYYYNRVFSYETERFDTEDYSFIHFSYPSPHGSSTGLVRIGRDGSYYDYMNEFESVSMWGIKVCDKVEIDRENQKVYIHYDCDYVIDLVTGEMSKAE